MMHSGIGTHCVDYKSCVDKVHRRLHPSTHPVCYRTYPTTSRRSKRRKALSSGNCKPMSLKQPRVEYSGP